MLLQEHGRQNNGYHEDEGAAPNQPVFSKTRVIYDSPVSRDGIKHVQARENIRRRIRLIQDLHREGENIVPLEGRGAQQVSVRVDSRYDEKQRHARKQENAVAVKFTAAALKEQVYKNRCHVHKPEQVGYDKIFYKRNLVVQPYVNHMVGLVRPAFQPQKPGHVNQSVK